MSQPDPRPVKKICVVLAALALGLTALAASARQQDEPPQPGVQTAQPPANEAQAPADAPPVDAPATQPSSDPAGEAVLIEPALAERMFEMAQALLRQQDVTEPMWRQAGALLHAASRLSPKDQRFHRLLIESRLKVGDTDGAIDALSAYRKVDPGDRIAQIQLIDLYATRIQTADARLAYLRDLLDRPSIPEEVRSHVATAAAQLLLERSHDDAAAMVEESLKLFSLNPDALQLKFEMLEPGAPPAARAAVLMAMLRSNAAQPNVVNELARVLGDAGMAKDSLEWYSVAMKLYPRTGQAFPEGFVADAGAQVLLSGQAPQLDVLLSAYLQARPGDADGWFLKLIKEKAAPGKVERKSIDEAWNALSANLSEVCAAIAGAAGAAAGTDAGAAQPAPASPGASAPGVSDRATSAPGAGVPGATAATKPATAADALAAARQIKSGGATEWEPALVSTLTDLAWLELYFGEDAAAATNWVAALREVLPADSLTLARLDGWLDLVAGRADDARAKLTPIADRDPLAAVGVVRLAAKDAGGEAAAAEQATKLLTTYRSGLVGAMVWSALRDRDIKPPEAEGAADVRAELGKFPRDWMEIVNQPEAYYEILADVGKVAHKYREPMLGRITLRNKTDYDLTIGPDGIIRPDLWFDARTSGLVNQSFPGVAYDRVARQVVLRARETIAQIVRIDQGALAEALEQNPSASAQINSNVLTNPAPTPSGVGPGPAGLRRGFNKAFVRSGFALSQTPARKRVIKEIQSGQPAEKIRGLDLLAGYVRMFARQKQLDDSMRVLAIEFVNTIAASRTDANKPVSIWARYLSARLEQNQRGAAVDSLLADDAWPARMLGLIAAAELGPERQAELAGKLAEQDPEPTVKAYAAAMADLLRSRPATQPAAGAASPVQGTGQPGEAPALRAAPRDGLAPGLSVPSDAPVGGARQ